MQPVCVPLLPTPTSSPEKIGGDEENRTPDPLLARQVLSHLSYTPTFAGFLRIRLPLRILPDPQN